MNRKEAQNERFASKCQIVQPTIDWSKIQRDVADAFIDGITIKPFEKL